MTSEPQENSDSTPTPLARPKRSWWKILVCIMLLTFAGLVGYPRSIGPAMLLVERQ